MKKLQIQIVTYNSKQHLQGLFLGIQKQANVEYSVLVIDNASTDETVDFIRQNYPNVDIIENKENKGFASAHNQAFELSESTYVLVLNHDVELQENCLSQMINAIDSNDRIAAVIPKTYKSLPIANNSGIIDGLGISIKPWGKMVNIDENKPDKDQNSSTREVWGASGSCVLYRLNALQNVRDEYGIYDERFWMYKEDADLSWRLNRAKWKTVLVPDAVAQHLRSVQKGDRLTRTDKVKQVSIHNHLLMLKKNLRWRDWWRVPMIVVYEFLKFIYILLFERQNLIAYK
tara:strand:- start:123 stop:986 length:864 start_codon:yes stop_codon:yes gene_type:complete